MNDYIVNYNKTTTIERIECGDVEMINSFYRRLKIYNPSVDEPMHKFWYYIQKAKLKRKEKNAMIVAIPSTNTKLIESIANLDEKINDLLMKKKIHSKKIEPSIITNEFNPPTMKLHFDDDSKAYDSERNSIKFMNISNNSNISVLIELDFIIISGNISRRWKIIGMEDLSTSIKIGDLLTSLKSNHSQHQIYGKNDFIPLNPIPSLMPMPPPPPPTLFYTQNENISENKNDITLQKQQPKKEIKTVEVYRPPTELQLQDMLGKLKKSKNLNDADIIDTSDNHSTHSNDIGDIDACEDKKNNKLNVDSDNSDNSDESDESDESDDKNDNKNDKNDNKNDKNDKRNKSDNKKINTQSSNDKNDNNDNNDKSDKGDNKINTQSRNDKNDKNDKNDEIDQEDKRETWI